jgi:hypothetical protein
VSDEHSVDLRCNENFRSLTGKLSNTISGAIIFAQFVSLNENFIQWPLVGGCLSLFCISENKSFLKSRPQMTDFVTVSESGNFGLLFVTKLSESFSSNQMCKSGLRLSEALSRGEDEATSLRRNCSKNAK